MWYASGPVAVHASYRVLHRRLIGGRFSQAIASFMPFAKGPHAVVWADRAASASFSCEAVAQFRPPLNSTHTSHSAFCADSVDHARNATNARTTATVSSDFGRIRYFGRPGVSAAAVPSVIGLTCAFHPLAKVSTRRSPTESTSTLRTDACRRA